MNSKTEISNGVYHNIVRMSGRDPHESYRTATPLELIFDLTFVIAFGLAASQLAHALAAGQYGAGLLGFGFASFAICWAWINFTWFASAYDTDDWVYRLVTMLQMVGVLVLAIGLPRMFSSIEHGLHLDNSIMVLGYVVMRIAMIFQWLRAAKQDPDRRRASLTYVVAIAIAQIGWILQIAVDFSLVVSLIMGSILALIEMAGPFVAERFNGGTPWHAHHIAERYSLFAIIALGEGVVGTVAALSAVVESEGLTIDATLVGLAGIGLTFGIWWSYYLLPSGDALHENRRKSFVWGYFHMVIIASIVAMGAGLHVAAYYIEHKTNISALATLLTVAIPLSIYIGGIYALYSYLTERCDRLHLWLLIVTGVIIALSLIAAMSGIDMAICLLILSFAPAVTVFGYETRLRV